MTTPTKRPRIRCYDSGTGFADRYTIIYTKAERNRYGRKYYIYLAASANPTHPQGFGQHGELSEPRLDGPQFRRINSTQLPPDLYKFIFGTEPARPAAIQGGN